MDVTTDTPDTDTPTETLTVTKTMAGDFEPSDCGGKYYFSDELADKACTFFEKYLKNSRGKPFTLLPWQRRIIRHVAGWRRTDNNKRRFKWVYCLIGRKNGKSEFIAALILWLLMFAPKGAELYAAAASQKQASIIFHERAKPMLRESPKINAALKPYRNHIERRDGNAKFFVLSGESKGSHGKNIYAVVVDELHELRDHQSRELWTALTTGRLAFEDSIFIMITTAGYGSDQTIWKEQDTLARRVADDETVNEQFYPVLYSLGQNEDWEQPTNWAKVNPSIPHIFKVDALADEYQRMKGTSEENEFKRLYLCQETAQQSRWLPDGLFDSRVAELDLESHKGRPLVIGVDTSEVYDITAVSLIYPYNPDGKWHVFVKMYMPAGNVARRTKDDGIPYDKWVEKGWLTATEGETIDLDVIEAEIVRLANENTLLKVAYDPGSTGRILAASLERAELDAIAVNQGFREMSPASAEFERRLVENEIVFNRNPVLSWMAANVEIIRNSSGHFRPVKPSAKGKYSGTLKYKNDGIVASIIATSQAMLLPKAEDTGDSGIGVYFV